MQKKLLAVAVASALGAPAIAMAQTSTVQIYGTFYMEYGYARQAQPAGSVAPFNRRQNIDVYGLPGSELGFKGEEKLGGGLSAWFQCTSSMNWQDGGDGPGADPDGLLCSRNSALGLRGAFGNVFIGRWDLPFKRTMGPHRGVGAQETGIWGVAMLTTGGSTSTAAGQSRSTFLRREANTLFYDSPNFGGFQFMGSVSSAQGNNGAVIPQGTAATSGVTNSKPRTHSLGAQYTAGPLYVSGGYQRHNDVGANGGPNDDKGWHVGASYTFGPVRVGALFTEQKFEISGPAAPAGAAGVPAGSLGGSSDAKYRAWQVGLDWKLGGPHGLRAAYTRVLDAKGSATNLSPAGSTAGNNVFTGAATSALGGNGYRPAPCIGPTFATRVCDDTGADMWQVRYYHTLSRRTELNLGYSRVNNDANAGYAQNIITGVARGGDMSFWGLAMRHTF